MKSDQYFLFTGGPPPSSNFNNGIQAIQSMPQFFQDSVNWGLEASYMAVGFMCLMSLTVYLFKK